MIRRAVSIPKALVKGKVLIIYGPRQVGKTTLVNQYLESSKLNYKLCTGDDLQLAQDLSECTLQSTRNFVGNHRLVVIDEAQRIPNIGLALKLMVDTYPDRYFIVTGSSAFDLVSQTSESLTGRKRIIDLFPISQLELIDELSATELHHNLESFLRFGSYPEVIMQTSADEKSEVASLIANSYLLRDTLTFSGIKNSGKILNLLKLLALQIGSQVSTVEIATQIGIDHKTVSQYLDLLEKSFVVFSLGGFSRNLRKEVSKMSKYYFYDVGIRNALLNNFNRLRDRTDVGQLFENFFLIERKKRNSYLKHRVNSYFWRTYDQKEIDLIEEAGGSLLGIECKWQPQNSAAPKLWLSTYPEASYQEVHQKNYLDLVGR